MFTEHQNKHTHCTVFRFPLLVISNGRQNGKATRFLWGYALSLKGWERERGVEMQLSIECSSHGEMANGIHSRVGWWIKRHESKPSAQPAITAFKWSMTSRRFWRVFKPHLSRDCSFSSKKQSKIVSIVANKGTSLKLADGRLCLLL